MLLRKAAVAPARVRISSSARALRPCPTAFGLYIAQHTPAMHSVHALAALAPILSYVTDSRPALVLLSLLSADQRAQQGCH
jgi:hypothetical protein